MKVDLDPPHAHINALETENLARYTLASVEMMKELENMFGRRPFKDDEQPPRCKTLLLTVALDHPNIAPRLLRTYDDLAYRACPCTIGEALHAATAGPRLHRPRRICPIDPIQTYMDASFGHNNPSREAVWEIERLFPDRKIAAFVSVGIGCGPEQEGLFRNSRNGNLFDLNSSYLDTALRLLTDSYRVHREMQKDSRFSPNQISPVYFRFHPLDTMSYENLRNLEPAKILGLVQNHMERQGSQSEMCVRALTACPVVDQG